MGLKNVSWRNSEGSAFVWCSVMAMCTLCMWELGSVVGIVLGGTSWMFHRPLVLLLWPLMMIFPFFYDAEVLFCKYCSAIIVAELEY